MVGPVDEETGPREKPPAPGPKAQLSQLGPLTLPFPSQPVFSLQPGHVGHPVTTGMLDLSYWPLLDSCRGKKLTNIAHQPGQPNLYQKVFLSNVYTDHTSVSWNFSPNNGPEPTLLLASSVQGPSSGLPLTSLGAELSPHWPGVLGPGVPRSERNCQRGR